MFRRRVNKSLRRGGWKLAQLRKQRLCGLKRTKEPDRRPNLPPLRTLTLSSFPVSGVLFAPPNSLPSAQTQFVISTRTRERGRNLGKLIAIISFLCLCAPFELFVFDVTANSKGNERIILISRDLRNRPYVL